MYVGFCIKIRHKFLLFRVSRLFYNDKPMKKCLFSIIIRKHYVQVKLADTPENFVINAFSIYLHIKTFNFTISKTINC